MVELREAEIDALIRLGLLPRDSRTEQSAVRKALYALLDRTLGRPA
jgi:hypothetical protein